MDFFFNWIRLPVYRKGWGADKFAGLIFLDVAINPHKCNRQGSEVETGVGGGINLICSNYTTARVTTHLARNGCLLTRGLHRFPHHSGFCFLSLSLLRPLSSPHDPANPIAPASSNAGPENSAGPVRQLLALLPMTALWALVAQGILSITRLLTSMTVGGKFSAEAKLSSEANEQLGYYIIGFSTLMMVIALFEAFITTPLTVFNQQYTADQKPKFSGRMLTAGLLLIGVIVCVSGLLIVVQFQTAYLNPGLAVALIAAAMMTPFQLLREFSRRWLLANLRAKESAVLEIAFAVLFFAGVCFLLLTDSVSAVWMFATLAIVNAIGVAGWWLVFRNQFDLTSQPSGDSLINQISANVRYGRWVAGENVCGVMTMYFCTWYLAYRLGEDVTGVFAACFQVVMLANPFLLGIASILAPKAAVAFGEQGYPGMLKVLIKFGIVLFAVMTLLSLLLWLAGDQITTIMFPATQIYFDENLVGQNQITAILGLALPAMGLSYLASCGLMAAHRPRDNFYAAIVGAIVLIAINLSFAETTLMTASISFIISFCAATSCRLGFLVKAFLQNSQPN